MKVFSRGLVRETSFSSFGAGWSSKSIRIEEENSSSNCLFLALQINAPRKTTDTERLAINNIMSTLMNMLFIWTNVFPQSFSGHDMNSTGT
jgi:hypothetical protein